MLDDELLDGVAVGLDSYPEYIVKRLFKVKLRAETPVMNGSRAVFGEGLVSPGTL